MAISKEQKLRTKKVLEKSFSKEDCVQCYFLKFSKELEGHQHKIVFKTRKKIEPAQVKEAEKNLRIEFGKDFKLFRWGEIIGKIIPKSKVYKIPFFDSREVKVYSPWRQCPLGYHWVREHDRQKKRLEDVDPHCRRNPSNKDLLKGEEMDFIANSDLFLNPSIKVSKNHLGMLLVNLEMQNQFDYLIEGWTAYWNDTLKPKEPLHPNIVKALIASESTFKLRSKAKNKEVGFARGLIQITEETQAILKNLKGELSNNLVSLSDDDIWDPNKNICAGVRWLYQKKFLLDHRLKRETSWNEVLMEYKGKIKYKSKENTRIKNDLERYLKIMDKK